MRKSLVFIGGAVVELLLDENYPIAPRISKDVDTIVEISSILGFYNLEEELRNLGFKNDSTSAIRCRWLIKNDSNLDDDIILDVVSTNPEISGFSNKWLLESVKTSKVSPLKNLNIKLITAPYFIATKLEAFKDRGNNDYLGSHDMEDIITVLDGKKSLFSDILDQDFALKKYYKNEFTILKDNNDFLTALPGHLAPYSNIASQRSDRIIELVSKFSSIEL